MKVCTARTARRKFYQHCWEVILLRYTYQVRQRVVGIMKRTHSECLTRWRSLHSPRPPGPQRWLHELRLAGRHLHLHWRRPPVAEFQRWQLAGCGKWNPISGWVLLWNSPGVPPNNPLGKKIICSLQVWTGTLGILQLEDEDGNMVDIYLGKLLLF